MASDFSIFKPIKHTRFIGPIPQSGNEAQPTEDNPGTTTPRIKIQGAVFFKGLQANFAVLGTFFNTHGIAFGVGFDGLKGERDFI